MTALVSLSEILQLLRISDRDARSLLNNSSILTRLLGSPTSMAFDIVAIEGPGFVVTCFQEPGYDIIRIAGRNKMFYGQARMICKQSRANISKISAGHRNNRRIFFIGPLAVRKKIIELLWAASALH